MSYTNPLHPPVRSSQRSQYTSLEGAVGTTTFLSPTRRRLPQSSYNSNPQNVRRHANIQFDHIGYNGQGVQMRELSARSEAAIASMIQGAGDPVLAHTAHERITFRIIWPGYEHVDCYEQLPIIIGGRPITRAQLGVLVAKSFSRFVEKTRRETCRSSEWNLTSSGIRFEHLVLVALVNVGDDVWRADVAVDLR